MVLLSLQLKMLLSFSLLHTHSCFSSSLFLSLFLCLFSHFFFHFLFQFIFLLPFLFNYLYFSSHLFLVHSNLLLSPSSSHLLPPTLHQTHSKTLPWPPAKPTQSDFVFFFLFLYFVWLFKCFSFDAFLFFFSFANSGETAVSLSMSPPPFAAILW